MIKKYVATALLGIALAGGAAFAQTTTPASPTPAPAASASPELLPNAETWLDFTDPVFIDPVGTGYSRFVAQGEDVRRRFFSVDGDVGALALVIRRWLEKHDRLSSPKFVAGESYGGIRGPKVVRNLQTERIAISAMAVGLAMTALDIAEYTHTLGSQAKTASALMARAPAAIKK